MPVVEQVQVFAIDANGQQIELSPIISAMLRLIVRTRHRLDRSQDATLELHFIRATGKVSAAMQDHVGLEKV